MWDGGWFQALRCGTKEGALGFHSCDPPGGGTRGHGCAAGSGRSPPQRSRGMATRSLQTAATSAARERMLIPRVSVRMRWCAAALKPRASPAAYSTVCMQEATGGLMVADKWP